MNKITLKCDITDCSTPTNCCLLKIIILFGLNDTLSVSRGNLSNMNTWMSDSASGGD